MNGVTAVRERPGALDLGGLRTTLLGDVARSEIHGAFGLVSCEGQGEHELAVGTADGVRPVTADTVFRVYSMAKPITSLAVLLLAEDGALRLDDDAARFLPALAGMKVLEGDRAVPARRPITVRDLLCHTSGLSGGVQGTPAVLRAYAAAGVVRYDHTPEANAEPVARLTERLGGAPLAHHPGTVWEYSRAGDVLGHLVEAAAGRSLPELCEERIFAPLGLVDTGWHVRPQAADRLAAPCGWPSDLVTPTAPPRCVSGGSGAFSTPREYLRFARMLLHGGELDGVRIARPETVAAMVTDHIGELRGTGPDYLPGPGYGFGLGVAVCVAPGETGGHHEGDFWWLGRAGTSFFVDRADGVAGVFMTQRFQRAVHYQRLFRDAVVRGRGL